MPSPIEPARHELLPPLHCCFGAPPRLAQEAPPTAMIVVDGSGSMWGNLGTDKRPKLEMVREALRALLPSLRPDARVGLASFGHRRRGNCGDAEVIVPPERDSCRSGCRSPSRS